MTALKPSVYILGIIFFVGIIMGGMSLIGEFQKSDSTFMGDQQTAAFNRSFNAYTNVTKTVSDMQVSVSSSGSWSIFGVLGSLAGSVWNSLVLLFASLSFMNGVFSGLTMFGVPAWIPLLIGMVPVVIIAFAIIQAITSVEQ